jgi:hypothetical protein
MNSCSTGKRGQRAVGDDQRPAKAVVAQVNANELACAGAEMDRRGKREVGD